MIEAPVIRVVSARIAKSQGRDVGLIAQVDPTRFEALLAEAALKSPCRDWAGLRHPEIGGGSWVIELRVALGDPARIAWTTLWNLRETRTLLEVYARTGVIIWCAEEFPVPPERFFYTHVQGINIRQALLHYDTQHRVGAPSAS